MEALGNCPVCHPLNPVLRERAEEQCGAIVSHRHQSLYGAVPETRD